MAAKVCSPSGAARKCRSRSSAGKTPYPSVLLHHFILKVCIRGRASSFTFSTDSASLATDTLLNMVFRSKSSAVSSSSKSAHARASSNAARSRSLSVLSRFSARFLRLPGNIEDQHIQHVNGLVQRRDFLRFHECGKDRQPPFFWHSADIFHRCHSGIACQIAELYGGQPSEIQTGKLRAAQASVTFKCFSERGAADSDRASFRCSITESRCPSGISSNPASCAVCQRFGSAAIFATSGGSHAHGFHQ